MYSRKANMQQRMECMKCQAWVIGVQICQWHAKLQMAYALHRHALGLQASSEWSAVEYVDTSIGDVVETFLQQAGHRCHYALIVWTQRICMLCTPCPACATAS
jgi:hypothetical protein